MPLGLGRLPFLTRRSTSSDGGAGDYPAAAKAPADPDVAPVGPPVLLPATIVRQLLFDATELTPIWARPRPDPEPVAVAAAAAEPVAAPAEPAARKRTRRASPAGAAKASRTDATPRPTRRSARSTNGSA